MCVRAPRPRSIQINDMEPRRSGSREPDRDCDRVVTERRFLIEVTLSQPDHATGTEVDGGQQLEGTCHP